MSDYCDSEPDDFYNDQYYYDSSSESNQNPQDSDSESRIDFSVNDANNNTTEALLSDYNIKRAMLEFKEWLAFKKIQEENSKLAKHALIEQLKLEEICRERENKERVIKERRLEQIKELEDKGLDIYTRLNSKKWNNKEEYSSEANKFRERKQLLRDEMNSLATCGKGKYKRFYHWLNDTFKHAGIKSSHPTYQEKAIINYMMWSTETKCHLLQFPIGTFVENFRRILIGFPLESSYGMSFVDHDVIIESKIKLSMFGVAMEVRPLLKIVSCSFNQSMNEPEMIDSYEELLCSLSESQTTYKSDPTKKRSYIMKKYINR